MRLYEIDESDKVWAKIANINLNADSIYDHMVSLYEMLSKLKSPYRNKNAMPTFEAGIHNLEKIYNASLKDDVETQELKEKIRVMIDTIKQKINSLPI